MEDVTLRVDAERADILRRQVAYKCGTAAETLHGAADEYALGWRGPPLVSDEIDVSTRRTVAEEVQISGRLSDALGLDTANDVAGASRVLVAPRERWRDLLDSGLSIAVERLGEVVHVRAGERPTEVIPRKVGEIEAFEGLLDRVGWSDSGEGAS